MVAVIFLVVGFVLVASGFAVFVSVNNSGAIDAGARVGVDLHSIFLIAPVTMWLIGGLMILSGILGLLRRRARIAQLQQIAANGVDTSAVITYVDRNYSVLVNERPIYSIVEYRYQDMMGQPHVNRVENLNTEMVIRSGWQVGMPIRVRYLS